MEAYSIKNLTFNYPNTDVSAISDINITVNEGEFILLCGGSGSGKSTLLHHLKSTLTPHGEQTGEILFLDKPLNSFTEREQAQRIGFVFQHPDDQIVTDKVWHELAFGLECMGENQAVMRRRVAEMASYFNMEMLFYNDVNTLSGGQKQLLNLASVMAMNPDVIILDEPTSQLDPIAASDFLNTIKKINNELGITIILSEHRLEEALPISDRVIVIEKGRIIADGKPKQVAKELNKLNHIMWKAMPSATKISAAICPDNEYALTVNEARAAISNKNLGIQKSNSLSEGCKPANERKVVLEGTELFFRYEKNGNDILKGLNLTLYEGEIYGLVGGNGTGKSTLLSVLSGTKAAYRGSLKILGEKTKFGFYAVNKKIAVLSQDPRSLFCEDTVLADLEIMTKDKAALESIIDKLHLKDYLSRHPYDLSGGEQQRVAIAKVLLTEPKILLLDEPTKGMDANIKQEFGAMLHDLSHMGISIFLVSHDIEFIAEYADRSGMMFDGSIVSERLSQEFFSGNSFYTTTANRIARKVGIDAVLTDDVIRIVKEK